MRKTVFIGDPEVGVVMDKKQAQNNKISKMRNLVVDDYLLVRKYAEKILGETLEPDQFDTNSILDWIDAWRKDLEIPEGQALKKSDVFSMLKLEAERVDPIKKVSEKELPPETNIEARMQNLREIFSKEEECNVDDVVVAQGMEVSDEPSKPVNKETVVEDTKIGRPILDYLKEGLSSLLGGFSSLSALFSVKTQPEAQEIETPQKFYDFQIVRAAAKKMFDIPEGAFDNAKVYKWIREQRAIEKERESGGLNKDEKLTAFQAEILLINAVARYAATENSAGIEATDKVILSLAKPRTKWSNLSETQADEIDAMSSDGDQSPDAAIDGDNLDGKKLVMDDDLDEERDFGPLVPSHA